MKANRIFLLGLLIIMICFQFSPGLCQDFTGNWSGTWRSSVSPDESGNLNANITQTGTNLSGTMNVYSTDCGNFLGLTLTGSVSGSLASFNATAWCYLNGNNSLSYTNGSISGNTMTGIYTVTGPSYYDAGTFTLTRPSDTTPNPFTFIDQTGVPLSTVITSNTITVSGINAATSISITGGTYSVNGRAYTSSAGTVNNGDTVSVRVTSSGSYLTTVNATLTIGGVSDTFSVTTRSRFMDCDFNSDGRSDILWMHLSSGTVAIWTMNGSTVSSVGVA